jgi:2-keto-4-pentenoate hydratase/2-oxohepta-3-ene-1,7-dioic acid hydratase in catechol pathway
VRIARFTTEGGEPRYGVVEGAADAESVAVVAGERLPLVDVRLLAPVIPRSKIVGVGRNYADHAAEFGQVVPEEPLLFLKPNTAVIGPGDAIVLPRQSHEVHFEGELAVVIGKLCRDVPTERALDVIFAYTVGNDVTARDLQRTDDQWARAKGFDTFCPLGPWLETELDPADLTLRTVVNGEVKQDVRTSKLIFDIPTLVAYISAAFTLLPGDVILTGTPAGVGPIVAGNRVEVTVEGIGTLDNRVVSRD